MARGCFKSFVLSMIFGTVIGCSGPAGILGTSENEYDIGTLPILDSNLRIYHAALLDPSGIHLDSEGYVIGVEKTDGLIGSRRVTHIIQYGGSPSKTRHGGKMAPDPCVLFSLLSAGVHAKAENEPIPSCTQTDDHSDYLNALKTTLLHRLSEEHFSHIIIMVMGWNTDQQEAVKNYNQISDNLYAAARVDDPVNNTFHPLVIGISWPSEWLLGDWSTLPAALVRGASFGVKKDQADQVGREFLSQIVTKAVLPARANFAPRTPVVMIGHSFGARALAAMFPNWKSLFFGITPWDSNSYYNAPAVSDFTFQARDRLILLEGAFDISELFGGKQQLLPTLSATQIGVTMTSSIVDTAFDLAIWGNYTGDHRTFAKVCADKSDRFGSGMLSEIGCGEAVSDKWGLEACNPITDRITIDAKRPLNGARIRYFDASKLINCQTPFGGGGAHDDFGRPEMGHFLFYEVQRR